MTFFCLDDYEVELSRQLVVLTLEGEHVPGEPETRYPDGLACPPSSPYAVLHGASIYGVYNNNGQDVFMGVRGAGWKDFACDCVDRYIAEHESRLTERMTDYVRDRI